MSAVTIILLAYLGREVGAPWFFWAILGLEALAGLCELLIKFIQGL